MSRLLLLIRSLEMGGAERQLVTLATGLRARGYDVTVATFYDRGPLKTDLESLGIEVVSLGRRGRWDLLHQLIALTRIYRRERPAVVHTYADLANIFAAVLKIFFPSVRLVWGIRASDLDRLQYGWASRFSFQIERHLASVPDLIIANSNSGRAFCIEQGYPAEKISVIPNGVDVRAFRFDMRGRERLRAEWSIPQGAAVVGLVGRVDPMKDHHTFLKAAAALLSRREDMHFVCVGEGVLSQYVEGVRAQSEQLGLGERLHWIGMRNDMCAVYSALDVLCSSSITEGFSNVIAEAMACSVPCVVTHVGDSASIVGDAGVVVPPRNPEALADGVVNVLSRIQPFRKAARARIADQFSLERLLDTTENLLCLRAAAIAEDMASATN